MQKGQWGKWAVDSKEDNKDFKYVPPKKKLGLGKVETRKYQSPTKVDLTLNSHNYHYLCF